MRFCEDDALATFIGLRVVSMERSNDYRLRISFEDGRVLVLEGWGDVNDFGLTIEVEDKHG